MSSVPYFQTGEYQIWLAGHGAYRTQAKALFDNLAAGLAERSGQSGPWAHIREILSRR
jgi:hypothetical protein